MATNYKAMKEAFVSNLTGGSVGEINYVTLVAPSAVLLWSVLQSRLRLFTPYNTLAFLIDFLLNCAAILFATTIYSSAPLLLNLLLLLPALSIYLTSRSMPKQAKLRPLKHSETASKGSPDPLPAKPFVTHYRGSMMVVTCVAILAVDFRIFPRRFAKVENWGTSLMDMGVGSFVFSSGVVSARSVLKDQMNRKSSPLAIRLAASMKHSLPLIVLGLVRLYSVKGLDYAEHVTEYGVHWNFFFTLGFLAPFVAIFQSLFNIIPSFALLSLILGVSYEAVLNLTNLKAFILTAPRIDLLSQNREGIFSFFGYLAIFLAGQAAGMYVLPRQQPLSSEDSKGRILQKSILARLATWTLIWSSLFVFSTNYYGLGLAVSRRLANLPYYLWVTAFNCGQITLFCAIETLCFPGIHKAMDKEKENKKYKEATSRALYAFNRNGLAIFLLANLLTGLANMTLPTLHMSRMESMAVLLAYISLICGVALALDWKNISIKI
ncbi:GPI-anchored wall transfer protein 1 [Lepidopterella palustris CBS 459.81]|uniref:GPI-anchored wall transfer protein n=1 Tax=Lepidopterella palustris CBS 459.81 TaxID=1314670 RepID=A0A8E2JK95_9PEZI|nr:GPI-anchored wall transfer protein 1 [Lepidopterella palustris CBS 459.81]